MNSFKLDDIVWGLVGLFTGGIAFIKMQLLDIGSDFFKYATMCFVALSAALMGVIGKKIGEIAWKRITIWYQSKKTKRP